MEQTAWVSFFENASMFCVNKILKQRWEKEKYSYVSDSRPDYGLLLVTHGRIDFVTDFVAVSANAGDIVLLSKASKYEAVIEKEAEDILINFDGDTAFSKGANPEKIMENTTIKVVSRFSQLVEEKVSGSLTPLKKVGLFYLLLNSIVEEAQSLNSNKKSTVEKATLLLQEDFKKKISEIAYECRMSESGLRKLFRQETGMSLTEYRLQFQINKAKYLLESTDMSVSEIADNLNFFDSAYFCKIFKKATGMSPKTFANNKQL